MNVKIKKWILITVTIIVLVLISFLIFRNLRLYDRSKPNIFEIPGTAYYYTPYRSYEKYVTRCYMVQDVPNNNEDMKLMVSDYIADNNIVDTIFSNETSSEVGVVYIELDFYRPSMDLPVYFEQNKSYFKMDDYIEHYKDELFMKVVFYDNNSEGVFIFCGE